MRRSWKISANCLATGVAALALTQAANAIPVTYNGGIFDIVATDGIGTDTLTLRYTANFAGWLGGSQEYIFGVDGKISGLTPDTILSFTTDATGFWEQSIGKVSGAGSDCGVDANGGICADQGDITSYTDPSGLTATTGTYFWEWVVRYTTIVTLDDLANAANGIRASFVEWKENGQGRNTTPFAKGAGLLSENTSYTKVPEPGTLALLGLGLIAVGFTRIRRKKPI